MVVETLVHTDSTQYLQDLHMGAGDAAPTNQLVPASPAVKRGTFIGSRYFEHGTTLNMYFSYADGAARPVSGAIVRVFIIKFKDQGDIAKDTLNMIHLANTDIRNWYWRNKNDLDLVANWSPVYPGWKLFTSKTFHLKSYEEDGVNQPCNHWRLHLPARMIDSVDDEGLNATTSVPLKSNRYCIIAYQIGGAAGGENPASDLHTNRWQLNIEGSTIWSDPN